jgi:hypothetical protein
MMHTVCVNLRKNILRTVVAILAAVNVQLSSLRTLVVIPAAGRCPVN